MRIPPIVHARVQTLLLISPPLFGVILGGMLVGAARTLVREPRAGDPDLSILFALVGVSVAVLALLGVGAVRVRRGAHTYFPRLWRAVPWTAAGGFVVGSVVAGVRALLGLF